MSTDKVIALSGGVGGAKLVLGLAHVVPATELLVVANTGDDFDHLGLRICPDIDSILYALSGLSDQERGWGRADETWTFMQAMRDLGGADWFNLGDGDLALHVLRTNRLNQGASLSQFTAEVAKSMGIKVAIVPMCDQPVATMVKTSEGSMAFQHYFVREQCSPRVQGFDFDGIDATQPNPVLVSDLAEIPRAIVIAPSNPYVSIDPILSVPGMRDKLRNCAAPIVAVSPIVGGEAIKGPAAKMMAEMGKIASALEIARHYEGFLDGLIIDQKDADQAAEIASLGIEVEIAPTIMHDLAARIELAELTVNFSMRLNGGVKR